MKFVKVRFEGGRGVGSKGSEHGLDFIMTLCKPQNPVPRSAEQLSQPPERQRTVRDGLHDLVVWVL